MADSAEYDLGIQGYRMPNVRTGSQLHDSMVALHQDFGWEAAPALGLLIAPEGSDSPILVLTVYTPVNKPEEDTPSPLDVFPEVVLKTIEEIKRQEVIPRQVLAFSSFLPGIGFLGSGDFRDAVLDGEEGAFERFKDTAEQVEIQTITTTDVVTGERFDSTRVRKDDEQWVASDDEMSGAAPEIFDSLALTLREFNQESEAGSE